MRELGERGALNQGLDMLAQGKPQASIVLQPGVRSSGSSSYIHVQETLDTSEAGFACEWRLQTDDSVQQHTPCHQFESQTGRASHRHQRQEQLLCITNAIITSRKASLMHVSFTSAWQPRFNPPNHLVPDHTFG